MSAPDLLARARLRLDLRDVLRELANQTGGTINDDKPFMEPQWLSDHRALAQSHAGSGGFSEAYWLDLRTGKVQWDRRLSDRVREMGKSGWSLSSDRNWLLYHRIDHREGASPLIYMIAVSRSDLRRVVWREPEAANSIWLPRTHRWFALECDDQVIRVRDVDRPGWLRRLRLERALEGGKAIGGLSPDRILVRSLWRSDRTDRRVPLWEIGLERDRAVVRWQSEFWAPTSFDDVWVELSPHRDRLLWTLSDERATTLAISRIDGSAVRTLGTCRLGVGNVDRIGPAGWLPSQKRIHFSAFSPKGPLANGRLYTLEVG